MTSNRHIASCAIAVVLCAVVPAAAQQRGTVVVDASAGWTGFADDGIVGEGTVGAAARWYLSPRVSIGPEFTFISGDAHSHRVLTGNVVFDVLPARRSATREGGPPRSGQARVTPYLVIGGGVFNTSESFSFTGETFSSSEGAFTIGGGVRAPLTSRVSVGADARMGWEPQIRLMGFATVRLGS